MGNDLYREICRCPEDDTLRLAYADWLDENGDPDRAEFVRSWYELGGMPAYRGIDISLDWSDPKFSPECRRAAHLRRREGELLRLHPEWSRLPCKACVNIYGFSHSGGGCPACLDTGNLFSSPGEYDPYGGRSTFPVVRPVTFARGFPDSVSCTLAEAFGPDGTPTLWACEVVWRTPVTRFVLGCGAELNWAEIPGWLIGAMPAGRRGPRHYDTDAEAVGALALAAGRLVRRHVYGEVEA